MPRAKVENPNKRTVPYNTEAEMYVLGSIIIDNKIIDDDETVKNSNMNPKKIFKNQKEI